MTGPGLPVQGPVLFLTWKVGQRYAKVCVRGGRAGLEEPTFGHEDLGPLGLPFPHVMARPWAFLKAVGP